MKKLYICIVLVICLLCIFTIKSNKENRQEYNLNNQEIILKIVKTEKIRL